MIEHIIKSLILAIGLCVDSFSISLVNGISYNNKNNSIRIKEATIFGLIQGLMPFIGYICLVYFSNKLNIINKISPYISLILLTYLGIKLLIESRKEENIDSKQIIITLSTIIMQGIATSIDAVSISFSMIDLRMSYAIIEVLIIAFVTILVSYIAFGLGKEIGNKVGKRSKIIGGIVLILIGIIIFIRR